MLTMNNSLLGIACIVGFVGDFLLQNQKIGDWGLKEYFKQHGSMESLFIAGGMMTLFYFIFLLFFPLSYINLAIFGVVLDFVFRTFNIFPSLKGYYTSLNYFWSAVWGAIPMMLPFFIKNYLNI